MLTSGAMTSADDAKTESYTRGPAFQAPTSFEVRVAKGIDAGAKIHVDRSDPSRQLVGTSPACSFRLTDKRVSRRHAAFEPLGDHLQLTDLKSTNGVFVNGVRIVTALLGGGEHIVMGDSELTLAPSETVLAPQTSAALGFGRVMGASEAMRRLYPVCERLARSSVPILIEGETGTGKELLAESLHEQSARSQGPFVVFDCSTISPSLLEAKLFGHERGAFTGAANTRKGVFELAHGGTIFIDEIGDLDVSLQARLLRAIERGEVSRVGSERWMKVDARVIVATRRDLDRAVQDGSFRDDLFFRLAVGRVELPPLRSRHGDVPLLAFHFWRQGDPTVPFPPHLVAQFERYSWPGNVRELQNTVARIRALGDLAEPMPLESGAGAPSSGAAPDFVQEILERDLPLSHAKLELARRFEPLYLARALDRSGGNIPKAAENSGVARRYFNLLVARHRE